MRSRLLNKFIANTKWGSLNYLIIGLSPGTEDEIITIGQSIKMGLELIVTTPQEISFVSMARKLKIPNIVLNRKHVRS